MERPEIYTDNYNSLEEWIELRKRNEEFVYPQFFVPFREWMKDIEQKSDMEIKELLRILLQPWSFVMNDELWNLMPMESSLNSSKSNRLPKWNPFFKDFAYNQYILYGMIHENANIHKRFEVCYGDNLHSIWAGQELYRKGNTEEEFYNILEKNMLPVYESARRQGYEIWEY